MSNAKKNNDAGKLALDYVNGLHAVEALLLFSPEKVLEIKLSRSRHDPKITKIISLAEQHAIPVRAVLPQNNLSDTPALSQGIVALLKETSSPDRLFFTLESLLASFDVSSPSSSKQKKPLLLVLDGVQDPHNLGACIRTANAAGAHAVIIPTDRSAPLNATARKVASGAAEMTPVITVTNLARALALLKKSGLWIYGMTGNAPVSLYQENFQHPAAFVLGSEGRGLRQLTAGQCDRLLSIPMTGEIESLNVSVAAGVCLFEAVRQRGYDFTHA